MNILDLAKQLQENKENIILVYAFNSTGKTRLSVGYKNYTKDKNKGVHSGIYYNAFSEDLFFWENDEANDNENINLKLNYSSLSQYHSFLGEKDIEEKLAIYKVNYKFSFVQHDDPEKGIESIVFYLDEENKTPIKISRGEERIFVWCFFLALFEVDAWSGVQDAHLFIDDPVSSLDEHNIFITAESIYDLIEKHYLKKRFIITTHHIGLFSILHSKLKNAEKASVYKELTKGFLLKKENEKLKLVNFNKDVFLFHLHLMQTLDNALNTELYAYHVVLLRQLLENISSFLGVGRVSYVLEQIGTPKLETDEIMTLINSLSHKNVYRYQFNKLAPVEEETFRDLFYKIQTKYRFVY